MSTLEDTMTKELMSIDEEINKLRKKRIELNSRMAEKTLEKDYEFEKREGGKVKLSELFGDKKYLFTIHNMGKRCSYCSMWADGFNDTYKHIEKKGAFVLVSPDKPEVQREISAERGWKFPMISDSGEFTSDMGYVGDKNDYWPGLSVFEKSENGQIRRISKDFFGPTDFYCNVWHFYDLLPSEDITINS